MEEKQTEKIELQSVKSRLSILEVQVQELTAIKTVESTRRAYLSALRNLAEIYQIPLNALQGIDGILLELNKQNDSEH